MLFVYAVRKVGVAEIADGIRAVGWGLLPILAIGGVRFLLRAQCWRLCMPPSARLPLGRAFAAFLAGDAAGNITPLGLAASEPTKVLLTRHRLATRDAVASLAVDNVIYLASALTVVLIGALLMTSTVPSMVEWRVAVMAAAAAAVVAALVARRFLRGIVRQFSAVSRSQAAAVYAIHMGFHTLSMIENYLTLYWLLGDSAPTIAQAVIFESLNRLLTLLFKFVPFRVGVDEVASGQLGLLLGIPPAAAIAGAIIRKIRNLFWTGVGLAVVAAHRR